MVWRITNRLAPVTRGKVGIVLALASDDDRQDLQVRTDFIDSLRKLLERDPNGANFEMIALPRHLAIELDGNAKAIKYLNKLRGHFMLFGRVTKRTMKGKDVHVLTFNGLVRHAPIPLPMREQLSSEFRSVVPARVIIQTDGDFFSFEATSQLADVAARYIVGLAALASGDVTYAEQLLLEVERQLQTGVAAHPTLRQVGQQLPIRFKELYRRWLDHLHNRYTMTRDITFMQQIDEVAPKLIQRDPRATDAFLSLAMAHFLLRRNTTAAREAVMKARALGDATWRYSMAFLLAYDGDLDTADTWYKDAFKSTVKDVTVPVQCEEFIQVVLDEEPDKFQLHYCSGLINFHAKKDFSGAIRDFDAFLKLAPTGAFPRQAVKAGEMLSKARTSVA